MRHQLADASTADINQGSGQEPGQSTFAVGPPDQYPHLYVDGLAQNYWVDPEVTPAHRAGEQPVAERLAEQQPVAQRTAGTRTPPEVVPYLLPLPGRPGRARPVTGSRAWPVPARSPRTAP